MITHNIQQVEYTIDSLCVVPHGITGRGQCTCGPRWTSEQCPPRLRLPWTAAKENIHHNPCHGAIPGPTTGDCIPHYRVGGFATRPDNPTQVPAVGPGTSSCRVLLIDSPRTSFCRVFNFPAERCWDKRVINVMVDIIQWSNWTLWVRVSVGIISLGNFRDPYPAGLAMPDI